jgi:hypothetical protein
MESLQRLPPGHIVFFAFDTSYFPQHKVTSSCVLISVEESNYVPHEVTSEVSPCMTKSYFLLCVFYVERSNFYVTGSNLGGYPFKPI